MVVGVWVLPTGGPLIDIPHASNIEINLNNHLI